jgi:type IV secretory pathway VirB2 component (pilin)
MNKLAPILFLLLLAVPAVFAAIDFDQPLTPEEEAQFDLILAPVMKVYNFIKYAATVIAVLVLVFAGISFITAGGEHGQKEKAKNMAIGVIIGLAIIWVAPVVVNYIFT